MWNIERIYQEEPSQLIYLAVSAYFENAIQPKCVNKYSKQWNNVITSHPFNIIRIDLYFKTEWKKCEQEVDSFQANFEILICNQFQFQVNLLRFCVFVLVHRDKI